MSTLDDATLVKRCLDGDLGAFDELIVRHQKTLFNTALRMTGDREEAADLTQVVFIKAYERLDAYRSDYKFFSWIYRILINDAINKLKQRKATHELDANLKDPGPLPDEAHERSVQNARIERALRELPFDHRLVIVLRYFNDMSYREMSELLSLPEKTVKSRLYSARQNLSVLLERMGVASL